MSYRSYSDFKLNPIWAIIGINFFVLILTEISPRLITFLGLTPIVFLDVPWTIFTDMFVHAGFLHLFTNMLTLYFFGGFLTQLVGDRKFLMVYLVGGIVGNIFFIIISFAGALSGIAFLGSPFDTVVGASGAVFAVGGALAAMRPNVKVYIIPIPIPISLWIAVVIGFLIVSPFTAWQAHLGGLVFGLLAGRFLNKKASRYFF